MDKVEIRYHASAIYENREHSIHGITMHVIKGGNNRFIGNFDSIDKAVLYALNNKFEIVGISKV